MYGPDSGVLNINLFTFKLHGLLAYATALQMQSVDLSTPLQSKRAVWAWIVAWLLFTPGVEETKDLQVRFSHSKRDTPLTFRLKSSTSISLAWKSATPGICKSLISGAVT